MESTKFKNNNENKASVFNNKANVLVIYDIVNNKRRRLIHKKLMSYGFNIQKSAFEAKISKKKYSKMLHCLSTILDETEDSIRVYRFYENNQVIKLGIQKVNEFEEVIVI